MKIIRTAGVLGLAPLLVFAGMAEQPRELNDAEIADFVINHLARKRHGATKSDFIALFRCCQCDSNRFCRIAQDVYTRSADWRPRSVAIDMLDEYGDARQVPFLETCVTDLRIGPNAILVLNRIEGFTSNSVLRTSRYLSVTNQAVFATDKRAFADQDWALNRLAFAATRPSVDAALRNFTRDFVFSYASNNCYQICEADIALMSLCPSYKTSKRRLALLRHALPGAPVPYGLEYVTNAINELVAYPEANLPE